MTAARINDRRKRRGRPHIVIDTIPRGFASDTVERDKGDRRITSKLVPLDECVHPSLGVIRAISTFFDNVSLTRHNPSSLRTSDRGS